MPSSLSPASASSSRLGSGAGTSRTSTPTAPSRRRTPSAMRSASTSAGVRPAATSEAPLRAGGHHRPAVGVRLGVAGLDQQFAELLDVRRRSSSLIESDRRPELLVAQVGVADDRVVLGSADDHPEGVAQPFKELGELGRVVGVDGRRNQCLEETPRWRCSACGACRRGPGSTTAPGSRARRPNSISDPIGASRSRSTASSAIARASASAARSRPRSRCRRAPPPDRRARTRAARVDLLAGRAVLGDDVLVEARSDHAVDRVARRPQGRPAGVGDRDQRPVEQVEEGSAAGARGPSRSDQRDTAWTWSTSSRRASAAGAS